MRTDCLKMMSVHRDMSEYFYDTDFSVDILCIGWSKW